MNKTVPLSSGFKYTYSCLIVLQNLSIQRLSKQNEKYQTRVNSIPNRIVSAQQPYVRPIVRGKAHNNVEFGSKVNISEVDGLSRADFIRWEAYNEAGDLPAMVENYHKMYGYYPEYVVVDKIYMNRVNRKWMKGKGIKTVGPALGRPKKKPKTEEELAFEKALLRSRNHVEGKIGQGKSKYGLNQIRGKSMDSTEGMIHTIFFCMNLVRLLKIFLAQILITKNNYINSVKSIWRGIQEFDYFRSRFCRLEFQ